MQITTQSGDTSMYDYSIHNNVFSQEIRSRQYNEREGKMQEEIKYIQREAMLKDKVNRGQGADIWEQLQSLTAHKKEMLMTLQGSQRCSADWHCNTPWTFGPYVCASVTQRRRCSNTEVRAWKWRPASNHSGFSIIHTCARLQLLCYVL